MVLRTRNCLRNNSDGRQPMPAFWLNPKMSPLGRSTNISAVNGSVPLGPAAWVGVSHPATPSSPTMSAN